MPYDGTMDVGVAPARPGLLALWRLWRRRVAERREAAAWSDRELRDVGLTRGDIWRELQGPLALPVPPAPRLSGVRWVAPSRN